MRLRHILPAMSLVMLVTANSYGQDLKHPQAVAAVKKVDTAKLAWLKSLESCIGVLNGMVAKTKSEDEQAAISEKVAQLEAEAAWVKSDPKLVAAEKPERGMLADIARVKIGMSKEQVIKAIGREPDSMTTRKREGSSTPADSMAWKYKSIENEGDRSSNQLNVTVRDGKVSSFSAQIYEYGLRGD